MKKRLFTTILAVAITVSTLTLETQAAPAPTLVEQLNALTGNYIGYDMTYADKVQVLNACFAASASMQNYTLVAYPDTCDNFISYTGVAREARANTLVTKTFLYDNGNYMYDYSDSVTGIHRTDMYTPNSLYTTATNRGTISKEDFANWYAANNLDANFGCKLHQCAYTVEELAAVGQYTEIDGQPYLVCRFSNVPLEKTWSQLYKGERHDTANSNVVLTISLSNYGAYSVSQDLHTFAASNDPVVPNGHYMFHSKFSYVNVNATTVPAVPANYVKVF